MLTPLVLWLLVRGPEVLGLGPDGDAPAPFVLVIHGGPEAQEKPVYRPVFQYPEYLNAAVRRRPQTAASACLRPNRR